MDQGVKGFQSDHGFRRKDEKLPGSVDSPKIEPEPKPFIQANSASLNQVSDGFSHSVLHTASMVY